MDRKINLADKLDFSIMDLTAPNKIIEEILTQLPEETHGMISGAIVKYNGPITSYTTKTGTALAAALGTITEKHFDIQEQLGKQGEEDNKYECYLYTTGYDKYKYRMFFMGYGIASYPVQFTLEQSIAWSILKDTSSYILVCNNRKEVEDLFIKILSCKKVVGVMQELIRIHQTKKTIEFSEDTNINNVGAGE